MRIDKEAMCILEQCRVDGNKLFLPDVKLDRKLYEKVIKSLDAMGGKWNRSAKAHIFPECPSDLLEQVLETGEVTSVKQELQYFPTPDNVIEEYLLPHLDLRVGMKVLEPSAGEGAIAKYLLKAGCDVYVCEKYPKFREKLSVMGCKVLPEDDFLNVKDGEYDVVIANPPFTKQQDVDHVSHMVDLLKPEGMLVSVMSAGIGFRDNKKTADFKAKLQKQCDSFIFHPLPQSSFRVSGTEVNTVVLVARKKAK